MAGRRSAQTPRSKVTIKLKRGQVAQQRRGAADRGPRREATEATEKALNSLDTDASPQKNRLKVGRNANEEI